MNGQPENDRMLVMRQGLSIGRGLFLKELFDFGDVFGMS